MVHVATLLSVLIVYRAALASLLSRALTGDREAWAYLGNLAVASIPAALAGVLFEDYVAGAFDSPALVGTMLLVTGAFLWSTRWALRDANRARVGRGAALWMGIAQAFAILPGISRSGATVTAALWADVDPDAAAQFSFLMSIPVILGAGLLEVGDLVADGASINLVPTAVAFLAAAVSGVLAIRLFVAMLRRRNFYAFRPVRLARRVRLSRLRPRLSPQPVGSGSRPWQPEQHRSCYAGAAELRLQPNRQITVRGDAPP